MVAWSTGIAGSTAMTSHSDGPEGSDMAEFLQLQGVEPRDDAGCSDNPGDGGVVEQPGAQRGAQYLEVVVVAFRVVAEEAELVGRPARWKTKADSAAEPTLAGVTAIASGSPPAAAKSRSSS